MLIFFKYLNLSKLIVSNIQHFLQWIKLLFNKNQIFHKKTQVKALS
jgi:hypothetical protein